MPELEEVFKAGVLKNQKACIAGAIVVIQFKFIVCFKREFPSKAFKDCAGAEMVPFGFGLVGEFLKKLKNVRVFFVELEEFLDNVRSEVREDRKMLRRYVAEF